MFEENTTFASFTTDIEENDGQLFLPNIIISSFLALNGLSICIGLVGNIAIIIQNVFFEQFRSKANYFITCLAVSDIHFLVFYGAITVLSNLVRFKWIVGNTVCGLNGIIQTASELLSAFTLVASTMDRYFAILRPFRHQPSSKMVYGIFAGIWAVSIAIPTLMGCFSKVFTFNETTLCFEVWPKTEYRQLFIEVCVAAAYVLPLLILMITCFHIRMIMDKKQPGEECEQMISRRLYVKKKTIRVYLFTFGAYYICWLPKHVIAVIGEEDPSIYDVKSVHVLWLAAQWLALSHPAIIAVVIHITRSTFSTCLTKAIREISGSKDTSSVIDHEPFQRNRSMTNEFYMC